MSDALIQAERWLTLDTPLGEDALVATEASGVEGISRLFDFRVSALSRQKTIDPQKLLGKNVTLSMARPGGQRRLVNGIVIAFSGGEITRSDYRLFTLRIAPDLWLLNRTSDYKVFQDRTALQIVEELLGAGKVAFEKKLRDESRHEKREYCVQFGETNLAFIHRLLAEEGIFYYFTHKEQEHTLVLCDNAQSYADGAQDQVAYRQGAEETTDAVYRMEFGFSLTDAKWTLADHDFTAPAALREGESKTSLAPASSKEWEHFRYAAGSVEGDTLKRWAHAAIDASEAGFEETSGAGTCASFTPGHRFTLSEHVVEGLKNVRHVVTEVRHEAADRAHFTVRPGMEGKPYYRNSFTCIPAARIARVPLAPLKPVVRGPQTAIVVGPDNQEIDTDKYGRIRIQFPWDRYGPGNEKSSCYVRVAQALAGKSWGTVFVPRIGMEVVVHFLDGDPDRPLVTGAVYNGENMPPWALPSNKTKSGFLSRSTMEGGGSDANELSFEDKKGEEKILFHAEKDFVREVENDDTLDVQGNQTRTVKMDRKTTISEGNDETTIKKGKRTTTVHDNDALTVRMGNRTTTVQQGNDELTISVGNQTTKASLGKITLEALQGITLKCGSSTVELTQGGVKIKGLMVTAEGQVSAGVKAPMTELNGQAMAQIKGGIVKIN